MEIGIQGGNVGGLDRWAIVQSTRAARLKNLEKKNFVQERLSELLYGLDLDLEEMTNYRARLVQALANVDSIEQQVQVPSLERAKISRDDLMLRTGGTIWKPFPVTQKLVEIKPVQRILQGKLARAVATHIALNPKSEPKSFHTVGIVVAQGAEGVRQGSDKVELTGWGMEIMSAKDYPKVARLRLPPRYPSQAEIVKFRAS